MDWWRHGLTLAGVLLLSGLAVLGVSHWPVDDTPAAADARALPASAPPPRAGYGYRPPPADLLTWLRAHGVRLVRIGLRDGPPLAQGEVDVSLMDDDGIRTDYVAVSYDPQRPRSRQVARQLSILIDAYPARPTHALLSAIPDEPFSFHLFFGVLAPLLLLLGMAAGVLATARRRIRGMARAALGYAAAVLLLLTAVLPSVWFPGNESTASSLGWATVVLLPLGLLVAAPAGLALAALAAVLRRRAAPGWTMAATAATLPAFFLAGAALFDPSLSAWPASQVPMTLTVPALLAGALVTLVTARRAGASGQPGRVTSPIQRR